MVDAAKKDIQVCDYCNKNVERMLDLQNQLESFKRQLEMAESENQAYYKKAMNHSKELGDRVVEQTRLIASLEALMKDIKTHGSSYPEPLWAWVKDYLKLMKENKELQCAKEKCQIQLKALANNMHTLEGQWEDMVKYKQEEKERELQIVATLEKIGQQYVGVKKTPARGCDDQNIKKESEISTNLRDEINEITLSLIKKEPTMNLNEVFLLINEVGL